MLEFTNKGIYCVPGKFYIDPWQPVDCAVITHGHADHAYPNMRHYICQQLSVPILKVRLGVNISVEGLPYGLVRTINDVKVSLHPAGHIIGSAQVRMEYKGLVVVVSGDYKVNSDGLSTPFEAVPCHEFVTESTFGLPIYNWESNEALEQRMKDWVINNIKESKTSVFFGYSLGKAQRIMKALDGLMPLSVHYSIARLNKAYGTVGIQLPEHDVFDLRGDLKQYENRILILPPSLIENPTVKKLKGMVYAICSGWMQVRGARRWRSADAGFAISDHADWHGLLTAIEATGAEKIYVTHGQTEVFSRYLNELGYEAKVVRTQFGEEEEKIEELIS